MASDLFQQSPRKPLAEALRPDHLDAVIGQRHLLGPGKPLRLAFESGKPHSMILWGPPGVGKTTLARLTAQAFSCEFIALSAVFAGVKEIRAAMEQAEQFLQRGRHTILFVDEIHRFNKAQQDGLLPYAESGLVTLIGATTENPSFEVNSALLSRAQVYVLKSLNEEELKELIQRARESALTDLAFDAAAIDTLVGYADGDARKMLNLLEQTQTAAHASKTSAIKQKSRRHDKECGAQPRNRLHHGKHLTAFRVLLCQTSECKVNLQVPQQIQIAGLSYQWLSSKRLTKDQNSLLVAL